MDAAQLIATLYPHLCKTIFWPPVEATKYLEQGLIFDHCLSHIPVVRRNCLVCSESVLLVKVIALIRITYTVSGSTSDFMRFSFTAAQRSSTACPERQREKAETPLLEVHLSHLTAEWCLWHSGDTGARSQSGYMCCSLLYDSTPRRVNLSLYLIACFKELTPNVDSFHFPEGHSVSVVHNSSCVNNHVNTPHGSKEQIVVSNVSFHHCHMSGSWRRII